MSDLLNNLNAFADEYKGKRLGKLLATIFVVFLIVGLGTGYIVGKLTPEIDLSNSLPKSVDTSENFEGTITYIEPFLHPDDDISYVLVDNKGKDIILLKAKDQKLEVTEGHYATVYGKKMKTVGKEGYLLVDKVVIKNGTN